MAPSAQAAACPNEQLRQESNLNPATERPYSTELPDCRALEMVTPAYKNTSKPLDSRFANDGSAYFTQMISSFAGGATSFNPFGTPYQLTRTAGGWRPTALAPSPDEYSAPPTEAFSESAEYTTDAGATILVLRPSATHGHWAEVYRRRPDATTELVGPLVPAQAQPYPPTGIPSLEEENGEYLQALLMKFSGASRDLSHVVFETNGGAYWPGDTTQLNGEGLSLYEYAGAGNSEPELVGVRNEGPLDASPRNQGAELISDCGTWLGAGRADESLHAVSASGEAVFFTAVGHGIKARGLLTSCPSEVQAPEVSELYARIAGQKTLDISSPSAAEYPASQGEGSGPTECDATCHAAPKAEGTYVGASEDGSKVFFTTRQPLLNEDTDSAADLYMAELEGDGPDAHLSAIRRLSGGSQPAEVQGFPTLSDDGSHVFFVAFGALTGPNPEGNSPAPAVAGTGTISFKSNEVTGISGSFTPGELISGPGISGDTTVAAVGAGTLQLSTKALASRSVSLTEGQPNLYAADTRSGALSFIGTLAPKDRDQWVWRIFEMAEKSPQEIEESFSPARLAYVNPMQATSDGRFLLFESTAALTAGATGEASQAYRYDSSTGKLVRVSIDEEGHEDERPLIIPPRTKTGAAPNADSHPAIADDGTVVFESRAVLTADATPGRRHVYEYEGGHVHLIASAPAQAVELIGGAGSGIDPSGRDIFFADAESLVPADSDTGPDVYDARVEGGFPAPTAPPECLGDACHGQSSSPAAVPTSLTPLFSGAEEGPRHPQKPKRHRKHRHHKPRHKRAGAHREGKR
jgi:hypothetical protein